MNDFDWWDKSSVQQHSLDMRQFVDFRQATLLNGSRIIEAYNASGLTFTLLPDRGLDIWSAWYKGHPLTWLAPGSPRLPDWGQTWLEQFNGGLLTTCGLTHVGPPEVDEITGAKRDIHGKYTRLPATNIRIEGDWVNDDQYAMTLSADVVQSSLFGEQLHLARRIKLLAGDPTIYVRDTVTNLGDTPSPIMLLYHFNLGYPLVQKGARLISSSVVYPRDEEAWKGVEQWGTYEPALPGFAEQVFFHRLRHDTDTGWATVAVLNDSYGLKFGWDASSLPYFTQWKNTRQGMYVNGIEPGNCIPEGQNAARRSGRLRMFEPGESQTYILELSIVENVAKLPASPESLIGASESLVPNTYCNLTDYTPYFSGE